MLEIGAELTTVGVALAILAVSYLTNLIATLANVFGEHTAEEFSWSKLGRGAAKMLLWSLSVLGFDLTMNLLIWFSERVDLEIQGILGEATTIGLIGLVVMATANYAVKTYAQIKQFLLNGKESQIDVSEAKPDYNGVLNDVRQFAEKITPNWTTNDNQTSLEAQKLIEPSLGLGASVNPLSRRLADGDNCSGLGWQAHRLGTLINLYDGGYKRVEDLELGDRLISDEDEPTTVVRLWRDHAEMLRIKTSSLDVYYTPEHPLETLERGYVKAGELKLGEHLVQAVNLEMIKQTELSESELKLYGVLLSLGSCDIEGTDNLKLYIDSLLSGVKWRLEAGVWRARLVLSEQLASFYERNQPAPICRLSVEESQNVMKGIFSAEGFSETSDSVALCFTSEALARWVQLNLWTWGYATHLYQEDAKWHLDANYVTESKSQSGELEILDIEKLEVEDVMHIEVNGNHTYVAENIHVHNCSKYAFYLGTGEVMYYAPHPDYGPCNGQDMCNFLIDNYGFVPCGKINGAIFAYASGNYGHCGMVVDANNNSVNDANWTPLTVSTHYLNLDAVGASYCCPPDMKPIEPEPTPTPSPEPSYDFQVGDTVVLKVWQDAQGVPLVQTRDFYYIAELESSTAVLRADSLEGAVYARANLSNLEKVSVTAPVKEVIRVGDRVRPLRLVDYNGVSLYQWDDSYTVSSLSGDRAVLSARGAIWAAMRVSDLEKV